MDWISFAGTALIGALMLVGCVALILTGINIIANEWSEIRARWRGGK